MGHYDQSWGDELWKEESAWSFRATHLIDPIPHIIFAIWALLKLSNSNTKVIRVPFSMARGLWGQHPRRKRQKLHKHRSKRKSWQITNNTPIKHGHTSAGCERYVSLVIYPPFTAKLYIQGKKYKNIVRQRISMGQLCTSIHWLIHPIDIRCTSTSHLVLRPGLRHLCMCSIPAGWNVQP